jgi:hypothetical protein
MLETHLEREFCAELEPELIIRLIALRRAVGDAAMQAADVANLSQDLSFIYASENELARHAKMREALQSGLQEFAAVLGEVHQDLVTVTLRMPDPMNSSEPSA